MTTSVLISGIVVLAAIVIYIVVTVKGSSPIVAALIATALVALFAIGGFFENFFTVFPNGMASMFGGFFLQFTFGVAFGSVLAACGAADRMAKTLVNLLGENNFIYAIILVTILLGMTGAPPIALMPGLTFAILRYSNVPRYVGMTAVLGGTCLSNIIPGNMSLPNMLPTNFLGTNIYAAPLVGIVAFAVGLICLIVYCNHLIKQARKNLIGYDATGDEMEMRSEGDMPNFALSITPIILVLGLCAVFILVFDLQSTWAMVLSCTIGVLFLLAANHKYIHERPLVILKNSAENIQHIIVCAVAVCGFASVVANTAMYQKVIPSIMDWNISPAILVAIGAMITAALCADMISGVAAFSSTIGTALLERGVSAALIHRLSVIASATFDSMPHGGSVTMAMCMFGYDVKSGYKYVVIANIVIPVIMTLVATVMCMILY